MVSCFRNLSYNLMWAYSDEHVFDHLTSLQNLSIASPLLSCDCATVGWLSFWAAEHGVTISDDSVCYFPDNPGSNNVRLKDIEFKKHCPGELHLCPPVCP